MGRKLHLPDVPERVTALGRWQALNGPLGVTNFGINAVVLDPGEDIELEHDELDEQQQEVYLVLSGRAGFRLGGEEFEAGPGDLVAVPDPAEKRDFWALEPGTRIICFGAGPGGAEYPYGAWIADEPAV
jgi:Cupin domain